MMVFLVVIFSSQNIWLWRESISVYSWCEIRCTFSVSICVISYVFRFVSFFLDFYTHCSVYVGFCRPFCSFRWLGRINQLSQSPIDRYITCAAHIFRSNAKWPNFISIFQRHWRCWCWITRNYQMATLLPGRGNVLLIFLLFSLNKKQPQTEWCDNVWKITYELVLICIFWFVLQHT